MDKIWYKDPYHLFTIDNYVKFLPEKGMTFVQQLNSIVRFSIYFSVIIFILQQNINIFMLPIIICIFTYFIYTFDLQKKNNQDSFLQKNNLKKDKFTNEICTAPTQDNPFMNVLMNEYSENPTRKKACNLSNPEIKKQTQKYFDAKLYRNVGDIFSKESSDRQWVTNPITSIPNDQKKFAEWCWGGNKTCKEGNGNQCYTNTFNPILN